MREIIKDYGAAIGPTLAFILGLLALYGKYWFDQLSSRWTVARRVGHLQELVGKVVPPPDYFPRRTDGGFLHADEARNLTNLARFYSRLLALKPVVEAVGKSVAESGTEDQVIRFHSAKWWFDILVRDVEKWRATENFRLSPSDHMNMMRHWKDFTDTLRGSGENSEYILLKDRSMPPTEPTQHEWCAQSETKHDGQNGRSRGRHPPAYGPPVTFTLDCTGGPVAHNQEEQFGLSFREPSWPREYWVEILVLALGLIAINLVFIAKAFRATDTLNPASAGLLGDFVGGYVGTFLALASVVLLSATLRSQRKSAQVLNFEGKYFELLRLHRENVAELEVQGVTARKLFVVLLREYRSAATVVRRHATAKQQKLSKRQVAHIAYYCLFFGTGPNSSRMLRLSLQKYDENLVDAIAEELERSDTKDAVQLEKKLAYVPFEGHQSRLGHYYRHLYQAIRYVDEQKLTIDKYQYIKTIRAQLSNHEQALLLLNSLTPLGENWWGNGYVLRYRLVQNIPREFFDRDTELDLSELFPAGYFEWEENRGV